MKADTAEPGQTDNETTDPKQAGDPVGTMRRILELKRKNGWEEIAATAPMIPSPPMEPSWMAVADEVAFALGHLGRTDQAAALYRQTFGQEPTHRRASSLAYLYYDVLMRRRDRRDTTGARRRDAESDRKELERWMQEALRLDPRSIKDLYRLGVYESQVQSQHDAAALRAFDRAIGSYRGLTDAEREARPDLFKPYVRSLYGAARSSYRLRRYADTRRYIFDCIREDRDKDHVDQVYKLLLAGKACAATGDIKDAERAFRLALDAPVPGRDSSSQSHGRDASGAESRWYIFAALARLSLLSGNLSDARKWIEGHIDPHRRNASTWRLLGDILFSELDIKAARSAYENALHKDRAGRHLTLVRLGRIELADRRLDHAERSFEKAIEFRKKRYMSEDLEALAGLMSVAEGRGDSAKAAELRKKLVELENRNRKRGP